MNRLGHALEHLDGPPDHGPVRLPLQPGGGDPGPERGAARACPARTCSRWCTSDSSPTPRATRTWCCPPPPPWSTATSTAPTAATASSGSAPAIPPVGESRSNWEVFRPLAEAMGFERAVLPPERRRPHRPPAQPAQPDARTAWTGTPWTAGRAVELRARPRRLAHPLGPDRDPEPAAWIRPCPATCPATPRPTTLPFSLMTAPSLFGLNSSFQERDALRARQGGMRLLMSPADAAGQGAADGQPVVACNAQGEVRFLLAVTRQGAPGPGGGRGGLVAGVRPRGPHRERPHLPAAHGPGRRQHLLRQQGGCARGMVAAGVVQFPSSPRWRRSSRSLCR